MPREALARPERSLLTRGLALADLRPEGRDAYLYLLEGEGLLRFRVLCYPADAELFLASPEPGAILGLKDMYQPLGPGGRP
jgi:hypothetical protein